MAELLKNSRPVTLVRATGRLSTTQLHIAWLRQQADPAAPDGAGAPVEAALYGRAELGAEERVSSSEVKAAFAHAEAMQVPVLHAAMVYAATAGGVPPVT